MKKSTGWLIACLVTLLVGMIAVASIVIVIDPFFQYHKPLTDFPYVVDDQVDMNPGLAKNMDYDSVILGSSMVVNFNTAYVSNTLGLNTIKLPYNGAYPKDQSNIMKFIFDAKGTGVKRVFLGIDELNYSGGVDETKFPITDYLYDNNKLNDVKYVLNKDVLLDYCIRPIFDSKDKTSWDMIYPFWWQDEHYSKALVLMYYEEDPVSDTSPAAVVYTEAIGKNLDANIIPYIEAHPETTFTIFFPPYSILYWNNVCNRNELDKVIEKYRYITERLSVYENVEIFYFQNSEEIICNLNNYADYTHYHPKICEYMVQCFADGTHRVTGNTLDETMENANRELEALDELASEYDYDAIWDDWYN